MFDQHDDGSHEVTLHNISCPGCAVFPNTSGVLRWNRNKGITYSLKFDGIKSIVGSHYHVSSQQKLSGVGRFVETNLTHPTWIAETDDGTEVRLYEVIEKPTSVQTTGTSGFSTSCNFDGIAMFAVVEIPINRMLAFDNSTEEDYRIFFIGAAGSRFHKQQRVQFQDIDRIHSSNRCSITLSHSPGVALVSAHDLVKCQPSGWLAFEDAPTNADCEVPAFSEQNFISFINGEKVPFHWADRRLGKSKIRRTYFGWVKSREKDRDEADHQPLPFMNGVEVFTYGEEVLSYIPNLFQHFVEKSKLFDFGIALHPLWTAFDSVFQDRLALASISLERIVSMWESCKTAVLNGPPVSNGSIWKNKSLLKALRKSLRGQLDQVLGADARKRRCQDRVIGKLIAYLYRFVNADTCRHLTCNEKTELHEVIAARINDWTRPPNSAQLRRPFEDMRIPLSTKENEALQKRNTALHGRQGHDGLELTALNLSTEYFDQIRMLITKFVLKLCDYEGPYIDYASRPSTGNFEVKKLQEE